jgi:uncharacterized membrane protein
VLHALVKDIESAAARFIGQYLARASVAIPFIVAFGFATAALGLELTARFGMKNAFWMMAAGFCALGILAAAVVVLREREAALAEEMQSEQKSAESGIAQLGDIASEAATQAAGRLPLSLLAPFLASPSASALAAARLVVRNIPLVLLLALVILLFWPDEDRPSVAEEEGAAADTANDQQAGLAEEDQWREVA